MAKEIVSNVLACAWVAYWVYSVWQSEWDKRRKRKKRRLKEEERIWVMHELNQHCTKVMHPRMYDIICAPTKPVELHIERSNMQAGYYITEKRPDGDELSIHTSNLIPAFEEANKMRNVIVYFEGTVIGVLL